MSVDTVDRHRCPVIGQKRKLIQRAFQHTLITMTSPSHFLHRVAFCVVFFEKDQAFRRIKRFRGDKSTFKVAHVNKGPKTRNSDSCSKETCPGAFFIIFQYMFIEFKWESFPGNWRLATERYQSQAQSIKMLCSVHLALDDHDPYAKGFAPLPLEFSRLKQENMGAPSAGGIAHCSQKHLESL